MKARIPAALGAVWLLMVTDARLVSAAPLPAWSRYGREFVSLANAGDLGPECDRNGRFLSHFRGGVTAFCPSRGLTAAGRLYGSQHSGSDSLGSSTGLTESPRLIELGSGLSRLMRRSIERMQVVMWMHPAQGPGSLELTSSRQCSRSIS